MAGERSADVLVILGAQNSAQKRYREALYCLDRALQLDPAHVRAHYSRGQVRFCRVFCQWRLHGCGGHLA